MMLWDSIANKKERLLKFYFEELKACCNEVLLLFPHLTINIGSVNETCYRRQLL